MLALLPFFIFIFSRICSGYVIRGYIDDKILPLSDDEVSLTTVQLLSDSSKGELPFQETYLRDTEGNFIFSNVSAGEYLVVINSGLLETRGAKLKVTISPEQVTVNRIFDGHDYKSDLGPSTEYPLVISPVFRPKFIAQRESFSIFNFVKSPMNLMMIASLLMVFVFPKLMEGIDPEALKKLQEENQRAKEDTLEKPSKPAVIAPAATGSSTSTSASQAKNRGSKKGR